VLSLTKTSVRQREIVEIVLSNGWGYMRGLLTRGKADEPRLPPPAVLRKILTELGPFYIKFGQLLSTRPDLLPPAYIQALTALQSQVPPVPWTAIETIIGQQFSQPIEQIFSQIESEPVAAGSIAQIHRATLQDGRVVALKVQRSGIERIVAQDIKLFKGIAELVARTEFGRNYDIVALAEEFTQAVRAELDFTQEAHYADQLRHNLANSPWFDPQQLVIPKIDWELTTEKLLVMEWLTGIPILTVEFASADNLQPKTKLTRQEITTLLFRAFFQQTFIDGFFHADPHPGNIFYLQDERVALLDCGMIGRLDPRTQKLLTEMLLALVELDAGRCAQLTLKLASSFEPVSLAQLEKDYERLLRKYYSRNLAEINFSEVFYEILQLARKNKIRLPANLGLYAKSLANLEGVARQLNPKFDLVAEVKPLMLDVFRRQIIDDASLSTLLRAILDWKSLSLQSPRQLELLLNRLGGETLKWNLTVKQLEPLRRSIDDSANRLSFSILVSSLIIVAAIIST
jgi:ubiquinone biosynthesis protein